VDRLRIRARWAALLRPCAITAIAALAGLPAASVRAAPLKTWGGERTPPAAPSAAASVTPLSTEPPAPPPATIGTPVAPSEPGPLPPGSSPRPTDDASREATAIVRSPGHVGLKYVLEGVEVRGNTATLSRVVLRYVPYRAGDTLDVDDRELELTRFRLLGTGFFRDVNLSLRRGSRRGYAILVVEVVERNTLVLNNAWLGLSADAEPNGAARPLTAYGGLDVAETNLAGTGITLGGAVAFADRQLALRTRFADPAFLGTSWTVSAQLLYNYARDFFGNKDVLVYDPLQVAVQDYAVVQYERFGGSVGAGHDLGVSTQVFFEYRLEKLDAHLPLAASDHRGLDIEPIDFFILPGSSVLSTLSARLVHDTRDEPVLPMRGDYLSVLADTSLTPLGSDYPYAKLQARAAHWARLPWNHVLKLEGFGGAIFGSAPLFEKFYIGDFTDLRPDRVLDLNVDRRAAPNFLGTDIVEVRYGQYAASLSGEYRIPVYRGTRSIYGVDFFASFGVYGVADARDITNPARGYSGFATVPIDLTFNLGLRADTALGGVLFGVSNLLGFVPVRGAASQ
jgi:outer membrane protein insertion porin family